MKFLVVKEDKYYNIYCPQIYGMETWGTNNQVSIVKKRKNWY